jgi:hypothetical protein
MPSTESVMDSCFTTFQKPSDASSSSQHAFPPRSIFLSLAGLIPLTLTQLYSTKNKLGQNFAVLVAWIAVSLVTIPLLTVMMRRKEIKAAEAASRPKEEEKRI